MSKFIYNDSDIESLIKMLDASEETEYEDYEDLIENCGGPGSGVPGPCPENKPDEIKTDKGFSVVGVLKKLLGIGGKSQTEIDAENLIKPNLETPFKTKVEEALKKPVSRVIQGSGLPVLKIDNKEYVLKQNDRFSESEILGAKYAKIAGVTIPRVEYQNINGVKMNLVEHLPEGFKSIENHPKEERSKVVSAVPKPELEKHALYSYLIGHTDPNDGNFLIHDGKMAAIDTDPAFSLGADGSARYVRPLFLRHVGNENFTFSKEEVSKMIDTGEVISKSLRNDGKERDAVGVETRTNALRELIRLHEAPTVADLINLGMGIDVKNKYVNKYGIQYFFKG